MERAKYIMLDGEYPIVFPLVMQHSTVAFQMGRNRVTSAGEVQIFADKGKLVVNA